MTVDERFLKVHPATQAWWDLRPSCEGCGNMLRGDDRGMRCAMSSPLKPHLAAAKFARPQARHLPGYCIDARDVGGVCGPQANHFKRA